MSHIPSNAMHHAKAAEPHPAPAAPHGTRLQLFAAAGATALLALGATLWLRPAKGR